MEERIKLMLGDNMKSLKELPDNSVDSIVTDPPYGLSFMNKKWDYDVPTVEFWSEVYRVLKPGGHVLSFGGTRTYHRMAVNIEDAGFEIRDQIMWIYGSGFPKSHNIGKAIDKIQGNKRKVVGEMRAGKTALGQGSGWNEHENKTEIEITKGNSDWEGWGTAIKPAVEPICVARKPLSEKSVAENVLKWGTGGLNIDASRIGNEVRTTPIHSDDVKDDTTMFGLHKTIQHERVETTEGRFPANVIFDEEAGKILDEQSGVKKSGFNPNASKKQYNGGTFGGGETNSNNGYGDEGGASRFFYVPKVSKKERNRGLDELPDKDRTGQSDKGLYSSSPYCIDCGKTVNGTNDHSNCKEGLEYRPSTKTTKNTHPTVKPINLLTYLIRLVTPKNGVVMDCFMGSGSTGIAAQLEGFKFIGMEMDEDYFNIAEARINAYEEYRELLK